MSRDAARAPESERLARAALCRLIEPADVRSNAAVVRLGPEVLCEQLSRQHDGLAADVAHRLAALDPAGDIERAARVGIRFVVPGDEEWPEQLGLLDRSEPVGGQGGAPLGLWVRGPLHLADTARRAAAVVGARSATTYGGEIAAELGAGLVGAGYAVVSGGAVGIDRAAHRGAVAGGGPTIAVMACGVDRAYPLANEELIDHIAVTGLVISDLPPGCTPTKWRFLARNRIIAALGSGTVVVEAAQRSGAANTASWTESLHKPVMGVPGPITSPQSVGVHTLIRTRGASLVTRVEEVLEVIAPAGEHLLVELPGEHRPRDGLGRRDQQVLDAVPVSQSAPPASIARTAGIGLHDVIASLDRLTDLGHVETRDGAHRLAR